MPVNVLVDRTFLLNLQFLVNIESNLAQNVPILWFLKFFVFIKLQADVLLNVNERFHQRLGVLDLLE